MDFSRTLFALKMGWRFRRQLLAWHRHDEYTAVALDAISPEMLQSRHIRILVLDFDGVMAAHGAHVPEERVATWLQTFTQKWPSSQIAILSNKPLPERLAFFQQHYPEILFVEGVAKKPYPDGLHRVIEHFRVSPQEVLLVDDRWLTGMLAAALAATQAIYISQPLVDFKNNPWVEGLFMCLRYLERGVLYLLQLLK